MTNARETLTYKYGSRINFITLRLPMIYHFMGFFWGYAINDTNRCGGENWKNWKGWKVSQVKNKIRWNIFIRLLHIVYTTKLYLKLQLSGHWLLWDLTFTKTEQRQNISKSCGEGGGGELSLKLEGAMILCHQCADLSTTFKWLNIGPTDYLRSAQKPTYLLSSFAVEIISHLYVDQSEVWNCERCMTIAIISVGNSSIDFPKALGYRALSVNSIMTRQFNQL